MPSCSPCHYRPSCHRPSHRSSSDCRVYRRSSHRHYYYPNCPTPTTTTAAVCEAATTVCTVPPPVVNPCPPYPPIRQWDIGPSPYYGQMAPPPPPPPPPPAVAPGAYIQIPEYASYCNVCGCVGTDACKERAERCRCTLCMNALCARFEVEEAKRKKEEKEKKEKEEKEQKEKDEKEQRERDLMAAECARFYRYAQERASPGLVMHGGGGYPHYQPMLPGMQGFGQRVQAYGQGRGHILGHGHGRRVRFMTDSACGRAQRRMMAE